MNHKTIDIHTGLYGRTSYKVLNMCVAGLRETLDWNVKDPDKLGQRFTGQVTSVNTASDGEVVLTVNAAEIDSNGAYGRWNKDRISYSAYAKGASPTEVKAWFAGMLEVKAAPRSDAEKFLLHPASKTSQKASGLEVRAVSAALRGEDIEKKYGKLFADKIVGSASDPIKTEIAEVIVEETKRIQTEFKTKKRDLHLKMLDACRACRATYKRECAELAKEERRAVTAMKRNMLEA